MGIVILTSTIALVLLGQNQSAGLIGLVGGIVVEAVSAPLFCLYSRAALQLNQNGDQMLASLEQTFQ